MPPIVFVAKAAATTTRNFWIIINLLLYFLKLITCCLCLKKTLGNVCFCSWTINPNSFSLNVRHLFCLYLQWKVQLQPKSFVGTSHLLSLKTSSINYIMLEAYKLYLHCKKLVCLTSVQSKLFFQISDTFLLLKVDIPLEVCLHKAVHKFFNTLVRVIKNLSWGWICKALLCAALGSRYQHRLKRLH